MFQINFLDSGRQSCYRGIGEKPKNVAPDGGASVRIGQAVAQSGAAHRPRKIK